MMNADRPNEVGTEALWEATRRVVQLLVAGRYDELAKLSGSQRLSADELRGAVQEYGVRLQVPPTPEAAQFDPIRIIGSEPPAWAIACDLWSSGAPSDLTLELTLRGPVDGVFLVEVDDLHVL